MPRIFQFSKVFEKGFYSALPWWKMFEYLTDVCVSDHNERIRSIPNREPSVYRWRSRKWNLQNATQKSAQSNTPIAREPMWSTKSRVNFVGSATLDPLCVPSTTERENTLPLPKIKPRPRPWVFIIRMHTRTWSPAPNYASGLSAPRRNTSCSWESKRRWLFAPENLLSTGVVKRQESTFSPELVHLHRQIIHMLPSTTLTISDIKPALTPEATKSIKPNFLRFN